MITDLKSYSECKESGLQWLGSIPQHWDVMRNGRLFAQRNQTGFAGLPILEVSLHTGVRVRNFVGSSRKQIMADSAKYKRALTGDIAYNMMRMWQGALGRVPVDGLVSPAYVVACPFPGTDTRYFGYLFRTDAYQQEVNNASRGIVRDRNRLYWVDFKQLPTVVPPPQEQGAIVRFLDYANRRLERTIQAKRKVIALLNEQKQAIIHRAVTCGLEPNIPLKQSGIPWLGNIPKHWEVRPLKHWAKLNSRTLTETTSPEYEFRYLDIGTVGTGQLVREPDRIKFKSAPSRARRVLRQGDTIISTVRTYLKAVYFVDTPVTDLVASTGFAVLSPGPDVLPEFLSIGVQSSAFIDRVTASSIGIAYPAIAESRLGAFHLAISPNKAEQAAIIDQVRKRSAPFDTAIVRTAREIELLREYRTRLITDVVTGKLDVREAAARLPQEPDEPQESDADADVTDAEDEPETVAE